MSEEVEAWGPGEEAGQAEEQLGPLCPSPPPPPASGPGPDYF